MVANLITETSRVLYHGARKYWVFFLSLQLNFLLNPYQKFRSFLLPMLFTHLSSSFTAMSFGQFFIRSM